MHTYTGTQYFDVVNGNTVLRTRRPATHLGEGLNFLTYANSFP